MTRGQHTLREIMSQPDVWVEALAAFNPRDPLLQSWLEDWRFRPCHRDRLRLDLLPGADGRPSPAPSRLSCPRLPRFRAAAALGFHLHSKSSATFLLCISRSGTTTETVRAQEHFKAKFRGPVITVTCDSGSPARQRVRPRHRHRRRAGGQRRPDPLIQQHGPCHPADSAA